MSTVVISNLALREKLQPGDLGEVARLHGVVYSAERGHGLAFEAYVAGGLAEFFHRFQPARDRVWLYEDADRLAAMLFLVHREEEAQLRYFLVLPEYRGLGLGKELMKRYMAALEELRYRYSFLWTTAELAAAASLYTRHGFRLVEEQRSTRFGKALVEQKYEWTA